MDANSSPSRQVHRGAPFSQSFSLVAGQVYSLYPASGSVTSNIVIAAAQADTQWSLTEN